MCTDALIRALEWVFIDVCFVLATMVEIENKQVADKFESYPGEVRSKMLALRGLVLDVAADSGKLHILEETLKWGEPSYLVKGGSTIRMDWKASSNQYALYFNCNSRLVESFKEIYGDVFTYEGKRAIVFDLNDPLPVSELRYCLLLAMEYHKRKALPLLGA